MSEPVSKRRIHSRTIVWGACFVFLGALGLVTAWGLTARAATLRAFYVSSGSMAPTFLTGDRVCAELIDSPAPARGEIWVFRFPRRANIGGIGIKRVVGLPGDEVEVSGGRLRINGKPVDEPYLVKPITYVLSSQKLLAGEYFLMGDDRDASSDSHVWGPVPRDHLTGQVKYRVWPLSRLGEID